MSHNQFTDRMLEATFAFARLALSNAILINGGAAAALVAFLADSKSPVAVGFSNSILRFAAGAGLGGASSMLAYFSQRLDWELSTSEGESAGLKRAVAVLVTLAVATGSASYVLFFAGCLAAAGALGPQ